MTAITSIRPIPERQGFRYALLAFVVAVAVALGVAGGYALDDESSSASVSRSTPVTTSSADSLDRAQPQGPGPVTASADSLERQAQSASFVSTDNGCRLPGGRMPC
jgi:hypothetical protein